MFCPEHNIVGKVSFFGKPSRLARALRGRHAADAACARAREVVRQGQNDENRQPEEARYDYYLRQPVAVANVHEKEHHEHGFRHRHRERDDDIQSAEIIERYPVGDYCQHHQRAED